MTVHAALRDLEVSDVVYPYQMRDVSIWKTIEKYTTVTKISNLLICDFAGFRYISLPCLGSLEGGVTS